MKTIPVLGDILAIAFVTLIGFATHGETNLSFLPRFLAVYFPLSISWFLLAPWFGLFQPEITSNPKQLWRPALAMLFAAPLAALLRAIVLNSAAIPVFAAVLGAASALGITTWRGLYLLLTRQTKK
jgi:cytochrome c biogenesis protein CcdA